MLDIILENNEFEFNGKYYRQKTGVPMGSRASPELCDLRMYEILKEIFSEFQRHENIMLNCKYRDDGFLLYNAQGLDSHWRGFEPPWGK